jgi:hypothetical protein
MTSLALLVLAGLASSHGVPGPVVAAVEQALGLPGRVEVASFDARLPVQCRLQRAEVGKPILGSGRVAVRLTGEQGGHACAGWAWAEVRVLGQVLVTTRALRAGEPVADAVTTSEREVRQGRRPLTDATGMIATRALPAGAIVEGEHAQVATGRPGADVKVMVKSGDLVIEAKGRSVACGRGRACAVLPSGRQVEGRFAGESLWVELP